MELYISIDFESDCISSVTTDEFTFLKSSVMTDDLLSSTIHPS